MTNTKFRKRALLSSVAMLLVALVALGSATFAWFTSNPDAKANGLAITTTTSAGLVIDAQYDGNTEYTHAETLNVQPNTGTSPYAATVSLEPASLDLSTIGAAKGGYYKTVASLDDRFNADETKDVTSGAASYIENISAKLSGNATGTETLQLKSITTTAGSGTNNADLAAAVRIAVIYDSKLVAVYAPSAKTNARYLKATGTYAAETDGVLTAFTTATDLGTVSTTAKDVTIEVYLDGEDAATFTDNVKTDLSSIFSDIQFNFTLKP